MELLELGLSGKSALVTAATSGIGLITCEGLARMGARVYMNSRSQKRLDRARDQVLKSVPGAEVSIVVGDVSTVEGVEAVTDAVPDVDILINMAGGTHKVGTFLELNDADWYHNWDFNVMSGVRLVRHYLPKLQEKDWGRIIFVSSDAGVNMNAVLANYGVAKAGVIALSRAVAEMFVGSEVTCNCVVPGPTFTDWAIDEAKAAGKTEDEFAEDYFARSNSLLKRFAKPEEVANLILYVASPASSATRGAALRVEGGTLRHW